jgi:hypothetical protein
MHSSLIGKIEKAKRYAQEPDRVRFSRFELVFKGEHDEYAVSYEKGHWHCSCAFFAGWNVCSHTIAMYRLLTPMLPSEAAPGDAATAEASIA